MKKSNEFKEDKIKENQLKEIFPNICMDCIGSGWDREKNSPCLKCEGFGELKD